jgi:hypothetical protein
VRRDPVWVMFHEVAFPWRRQPLRHNVLAGVTRLMAYLVAQSAERAFVSIPAWAPMLHALAPHAVRPEWLPIPSNVPVVHDAERVRAIRRCYAANGVMLLGHFGTYGGLITQPLEAVLPALVARGSNRAALLLGRGGEVVRERLVQRNPELATRLAAPGALPPEELSLCLSACDLMIQPYSDGVSSRRTSAMAALSHAVPMVTTSGPLTEALWATSGAVGLVPVADVAAMIRFAEDLLAHPVKRERMKLAASRLYDTQFDVRHVVTALREPPAPRGSSLGAPVADLA